MEAQKKKKEKKICSQKLVAQTKNEEKKKEEHWTYNEEINCDIFPSPSTPPLFGIYYNEKNLIDLVCCVCLLISRLPTLVLHTKPTRDECSDFVHFCIMQIFTCHLFPHLWYKFFIILYAMCVYLATNS